MKKLLLLISLFVFTLSNGQTAMNSAVGYAPDFTVSDVNGVSHNLYSYLDSGYVMVLELMSVSCGHCIAHAAGTENSYITNGPSGNNTARFLGLEVNASTNNTSISNFANIYGASFPIANNISPSGIGYMLYGTPTYYVVYPDRSYTTICSYNCVTSNSSITIENKLNTAIDYWPPNLGCTDPMAINYDSLANLDDGSCDYSSYTIETEGMSFTPDTIICDVGDTINFVLGSGHNAVEVSDSTWLVGGNAPLTGGFNFGYGSTGYFVPDDCHHFYYVCQPHSQLGMKGVIIAHHPPVPGCTDSIAINYDSLANLDDGSCDYSSYTIETVGMSFIPDTIICDVGDTINFILGAGHNAVEVSDSTWLAGGSHPLSGGFNFGYGSTGYFVPDDCHHFYYVCQPHASMGMKGVIIAHHPPVFGCMDSTALNYDSTANHDDSSCTYAATCGAITGVNTTDVIHDRAWFNWDDMNSSTCDVDQIRFRYREVGTSAWSTKTMGAPVGNSAPCLNTSKRVINLTPSTQYEYDFKIWYQDGTVVSWHANGTFTTADPCLNVTNVTATPTTITKTEFCWTPPLTPYAFVRLKYRVDVSGTSFNNIGGMGVFHPSYPNGSFCKNKNGLTPGTDYRVMWRTWCNPSGGPYRSPQWDGPVLWTQPTSIRVNELSTISSLEIYPNPSRDVFNVSFTSDSKQSIEIRVVNLIGEVIFTENLEDFEGKYTHSFNLEEYSKGVYLLELDTDNGIVNKKLILQ